MYRYEIEATSHQDAWLKFVDYFDLAIGLLEFACTFRSYRIKFGSGTHGEIKYGDHVVIDQPSGNTLIYRLSHITDVTEPEFPVSYTIFKEANRTRNANFTMLRLSDWRNPSSIDSLIAKSLKLYGDSANSIYEKDRLLHYWQMAEQLTCAKSRKGNTLHVSHALAWLAHAPELPANTIRYAVEHIANARNRIVHENHVDHPTSASADPANLLGTACQLALHWILLKRNTIGTRERLSSMLDIYAKPREQMELYSSAIDVLKNELQYRTAQETLWANTSIYRR